MQDLLRLRCRCCPVNAWEQGVKTKAEREVRINRPLHRRLERASLAPLKICKSYSKLPNLDSYLNQTAARRDLTRPTREPGGRHTGKLREPNPELPAKDFPVGKFSTGSWVVTSRA